MVKYCFTSHQLIYDYVERDYDNDDEIDRNSVLHFKDKLGILYISYHIDMI